MELDPLDAMVNSKGALGMSAMKWIKERSESESGLILSPKNPLLGVDSLDSNRISDSDKSDCVNPNPDLVKGTHLL